MKVSSFVDSAMKISDSMKIVEKNFIKIYLKVTLQPQR